MGWFEELRELQARDKEGYVARVRDNKEMLLELANQFQVYVCPCCRRTHLGVPESCVVPREREFLMKCRDCSTPSSLFEVVPPEDHPKDGMPICFVPNAIQ